MRKKTANRKKLWHC